MFRRGSHGELNLIESIIPADAKKIEIKKRDIVYRKGKKAIKLAASETSGNHHCVEIDRDEDVDFFEDKNGVLYIKNKVQATIFCVDERRHDTCVLSPPADGLAWKRSITQEWDYIKMEKRAVRD